MGKVPLPQPAKSVVVLAITAVAGFVDASCWLILLHIFVANLTGNFVAIAIGGLEHDPARALRGGLAVAEFLAGAVAGRLSMRLAERRGVAPAASVPLAFEAALLALFALTARAREPADATGYLLAALPALAMGAQNVTLRRLGELSFYTTHLTGNVTRLAETLSDALAWDRAPSQRWSDVRKAGFLTAMLGFFAVGALLGVWFESRLGAAALAVPVGALAIIIAVDVTRPLLEVPRR